MSDATSPRKVEGLIGTVGRGPFATGSKSQRESIWIGTTQGRYALRRKDGPSVGDAELERFVGKKVECDGFILDYMVLAERIRTID